MLDGSADAPALDLCLVREGLARHCTDAEIAFAVHGLGAHPIIANGAPEAVERWIPQLARGEAVPRGEPRGERRDLLPRGQ